MDFKNTAIAFYRFANSNRHFIRKERGSKLNLKISKKIKWVPKGFLSESEVIYDFSKNNIEDYLTDRERLRTRYLNAPYSFVLDDKVVFEAMYNRYLSIPKSFAYISKGRVSSLDFNFNINSVEDIFEFLDKYKACVIKPARNDGGYGVHILKKSGDKYYVNSEEVNLFQLKEKTKGMHEYFMSEYLSQGEFATSFFPKTTNTVRILTMIDEERQEAFIPMAVQRIGNSTSAPVDNWTAGGLSARINLETGEIGKGVTYPKNGKLEWYANHPESGVQIEGKVIPMWEEIKESILKAANSYPYIKYIGWDIVLTDNGYAVLEGNNIPDVNLMQVHTPLLKLEKVKEFYDFHNILKRQSPQ